MLGSLDPLQHHDHFLLFTKLALVEMLTGAMAQWKQALSATAC